MGKEEIARNEQFLLFQQGFLLNQNVFLLNQKIVSPPFVNIYDIISLFIAEIEEPKIDMQGKGFMIIKEQLYRCHKIINMFELLQ